jgi:hypothetical protein
MPLWIKKITALPRLAIGILACGAAMYFMYAGNFMKSLFNDWWISLHSKKHLIKSSGLKKINNREFEDCVI